MQQIPELLAQTQQQQQQLLMTQQQQFLASQQQQMLAAQQAQQLQAQQQMLRMNMMFQVKESQHITSQNMPAWPKQIFFCA